MKNKINKIKFAINNNRTLIGNFSFLSLLTVLNLIIPLATYPYLIRVLGKEIYGVIIFVQAIIGYFVILVSFGFNMSATKDISQNRNNATKLSEIISSILIIKFILLIISFLLLIISLFFIPKAHGYHNLFFLTMWLAIYEFMFPIWYFQGIEKMKYITYITLISKITFLVLIFIFIKSPQDYLKVPIINAIGAFIAGAFSLHIIFKQHNIKFKFQNISTLRKYFMESVPLFISTVSITIFVQANKIIIGSFIGMAEVAYYDLAEKIVQLLKTPQLLITQAIFPKTSREKNIPFIKKMMLYSIIFAIILFIFTQIFANYIVIILAGKNMQEAVELLRVFSIVILIVYISQYTAVHTLLANGFNRIWMRIMIISSILYFLMVVLLVYFNTLTVLSLVCVTIISELYMLLSSYWYSKRLELI